MFDKKNKVKEKKNRFHCFEFLILLFDLITFSFQTSSLNDNSPSYYDTAN